MKMRLRPSRSASRPPVTINTPNTNAYPLITHCEVVRSVPRSFSICGIATLSAVKSFAITNTPSAIATSARIVPRSSWSAFVLTPAPLRVAPARPQRFAR